VPPKKGLTCEELDGIQAEKNTVLFLQGFIGLGCKVRIRRAEKEVMAGARKGEEEA